MTDTARTPQRASGARRAATEAARATRIRRAARRAATVLHTPRRLPPLDPDYLAAEAMWETWRRANGDD